MGDPPSRARRHAAATAPATAPASATRTAPVTAPAPVGITYEPVTRRVWVACYDGSIRVYDDR